MSGNKADEEQMKLFRAYQKVNCGCRSAYLKKVFPGLGKSPGGHCSSDYRCLEGWLDLVAKTLSHFFSRT